MIGVERFGVCMKLLHMVVHCAILQTPHITTYNFLCITPVCRLSLMAEFDTTNVLDASSRLPASCVF